MKEKLDYREIYKKRILCILKQNDKKCVPYKTLYAKVKGKKPRPDEFKAAVREMKESGDIFERKDGFVICASYGIFTATVARVAKTFGFITRQEDGVEIFVPGKFLKGAMPNDVVLAYPPAWRKPRGRGH